MVQELKLDHTIDYETIKKLNKILQPSGWSVGKIFYQLSMLELDIKRASSYAYYSKPGETENNYALKRSLEKKLENILRDEEREEAP
jgi:hypothetical protein